METIRFANVNDFEAFAQKRMDRDLYEFLRGPKRPDEHQSDFALIKLKLRGMINMARYKGLKTHVLG